MRIRPADPSDIPAVAAIKVESWRHAYRGIVPDAVLDALTAQEVQAQWLGVAPAGFAGTVLVAEGPEGITGYTMSGPVREPAGDFPGQLYAIYLRPSQMRAGLGTALFRATAQRLAAQGLSEFLLWVLEANTPARAFYERHGGMLIPGARLFTELGGAQLPELAYGFRIAVAV
jgi:ribosomal protein S18 acetylase RimI-like enzyme